MRTYRQLLTLASLALAALLGAGPLGAQGVTTGAIRGLVTTDEGQPVENAQVQIVNTRTGFTSGTLTRANGLYLAQGLEVGGPYTLRVRRIGFEPVERTGIMVSLSQATQVDVVIRTQAVELSGVVVSATTDAADFSATRQGVGTTIGDTLIRRIPTLNRDFTDLVKLSPQVTQPTVDGPSAGGAYNRLNNFTIDGANQNDRFNLGSSEGVPGGATGGRLISIDAVKEFQVLMSPTDVRQGNFAGMLVNAVTRNGTNEWTGGATFTYRSPDLAANEDFLEQGDLQVRQYGFHLGGPIIRDRLHFFIAPEFQSRSAPSSGPFFGQPASTTGLVSEDSVQRIADIISGRTDGFDVGGGDPLRNANPLTNLFGRLDFQIDDANRLVFRQLYNTAEQDEFSRNTRTFTNRADVQNSGFRLTSNSFVRENTNSSTVVQLFTNFAGGASNEVIASYNRIKDERIVPVRTPEVSVGVVASADEPSSTANNVVTFGTEQFSPGNLLEQDIAELANNYSFPLGAHTITVGGRFEYNKFYNNFAQRSFGVWVFPTIDALEAEAPSGYSFGYDNGGGIAADFRTHQYSLYGQDQWAFSPNLTISYGLRLDVPRFVDEPVANPDISAAFPGISTSDVPETQLLWSPRIGFNWNPDGDQQNQVRGNIGIYTGPPPFILVANSFANNGLGLVTLTCNGADAATAVPTFTLDVDNLPRACLGQPEPAAGAAGTTGINVTDPDFRYPQNFTTTLGFDRRLPGDVIFTFEGLYRRAINGIRVRDLNISGPRMVGGQIYRDRDGRVLYMDTVTYNATGRETVTNSGQKVITSLNGVTFSDGLIQVTNQSKDWSYSLSGQLKKRFSESFSLTGAYTFMQAKDVMSLTSDRAISNWRNGRQYAGLESDDELGTSYFERPHRVLLYGTYTAPWKTTDISLYYEGMSGTPLTYVANGDLNGDGNTNNDPIYIPTDATDASEIRIGTGAGTGFALDADEAQAFEDFIRKQDCLDDQRGQIMERNSCRSPWQNRMDVSLRQSIPQIAGQRLTVQLDIINFLNLLNKNWGQIDLPTLSDAFPQQQVLRTVGRTAGDLSDSQTNFTFEGATKSRGPFFDRQDVASNFYQMQLTLRYSF